MEPKHWLKLPSLLVAALLALLAVPALAGPPPANPAPANPAPANPAKPTKEAKAAADAAKAVADAAKAEAKAKGKVPLSELDPSTEVVPACRAIVQQARLMQPLDETQRKNLAGCMSTATAGNTAASAAGIGGDLVQAVAQVVATRAQQAAWGFLVDQLKALARCPTTTATPAAGATCAVDGSGVPTITCKTNDDCAACKSDHQVCDPTAHKCAAPLFPETC